MAKKEPAKTAGDLMAQLRGDPEWQLRSKERARRRRDSIEAARIREQPIIAELRKKGVRLSNLDSLRTRDVDAPLYRTIVPVLLQCLRESEGAELRDTLVRGLSRPEAGEAAAKEFWRLFQDPGWALERWALANGIANTASSSQRDEVLELVQEPQYGRDREMLLLALARFGDDDSNAALRWALTDSDLRPVALGCYGKDEANGISCRHQALCE